MPAMPSPTADIREQNIAFGARADAHVQKIELRPKSIKGYKLPPSSLLHAGEAQTVVREDALRAEAQVLVEKCAEFGVAGRVEQINPGPVVTTFEFRPDAGVKYSRVTGLADDLCLAMAAESILIERMAGKSTVGIQVPNTERETIWLRDVVESEHFAATKSKLPIALGKDIDGRIVCADLASMPHVLIAGSTGSGKSVAINAMIMSVLFRSTPEQVRMILVDPKRVELGMYEGIPHLFTPIITEAKLAANALKNAVREMERRLKLLAANHVRNIDQFNKLFDHGSDYLFEDVNQEPLPYIIIVIDELADLMMLDRANVEEAITRLAQMARAVGIHLVLATQRPSVDVITGLLKANVPTRMSFRLATKIDSRTIIDTNGAESLLGRGDMLFLPPGTSRLQRVHAPFVTEREIAAVTKFWKDAGRGRIRRRLPRRAQGREGGRRHGFSQRGRRGRSDVRRRRPPGLRVRQGLHVAPAAPSPYRLRSRRAPDRHDGARRARRSRRRLQAPRTVEASRLLQRGRRRHAISKQTQPCRRGRASLAPASSVLDLTYRCDAALMLRFALRSLRASSDLLTSCLQETAQCGHAAPWETQSSAWLRNSALLIGAGARPSPGSHAHRTSGVFRCTRMSCGVRWPFCAGSLNSSQICRSVRPFQIIGVAAGGSPQSGAPGGACSPAMLWSW